MRIFKLTFLLLTILVILSAVDVGECGKFKDAMKKVGQVFVKAGEKIGTGVKTVVKGVVKFEKAIDHFGGNIVPKVLDVAEKITGH
ncbi:unnamed protein product [Cylicocyclus nassatus]|uniref:Uncharacterized protein n=1 Tax=Cylicocyclus nassatus TaxID=53992 RepID=A0AA36GM63_CYLNA|nr:unnamed protein product [Cylicocyclus nassatus]